MLARLEKGGLAGFSARPKPMVGDTGFEPVTSTV